ncbi:unnamed protein product, partial [Meganyctiphanes norvegica]
YKLICADRFYLYVCQFCNNGRDFLHRLPIMWDNVVHLALWNLYYSKQIVGKSGRYFDYLEQIVPWVNNHWDILQIPQKLEKVSVVNRTQQVLFALQSNPYVFKCGKEIRKKNSLWTLRTPDPPYVMGIILPLIMPFTESALSKINYCERVAELPEVPKTFKVDAPEFHMRGSMKHYLIPQRMDNDKALSDDSLEVWIKANYVLAPSSCIEEREVMARAAQLSVYWSKLTQLFV